MRQVCLTAKKNLAISTACIIIQWRFLKHLSPAALWLLVHGRTFSIFSCIKQSTSDQNKKVKEVQITVKILTFYLNSQPSLMNVFSIYVLRKMKSVSYMFVGFLLKIVGVVLYLVIDIKRNFNICLFESWNIWASNNYYLLLYYWMRWSAKGTGNLDMVFIIILPTLSKSIVILVFLLTFLVWQHRLSFTKKEQN